MDNPVLNDAQPGGERESLPSSTAVEMQARIDAEGLTMSQVATESGIPKGTLGSYLKGNYAGRVENQDEKARKWLDSRAMRERMKRTLPTQPDFIATPTAQTFFSVFEYAQGSPDIGLITGGAGVGKTLAAEKYISGVSNGWMMTANSSMRSPTAILRRLTNLLDCDARRGPEMEDAILRRIDGTRGLLIVDEAQHLLTESIDLLRFFHDEGGIGIVFMGNDPLKGRIEGMGRQASHAQIFSRVGMRKSRSKPQYQDVQMVLDGWGIADQGLRKVARYIAMSPGGLRQMNKVLRYAGMLSGGGGISLENIEAAWVELTGARLPNLGGDR